MPSTVFSICKSFSTSRANETNALNLPPGFTQLRPEEHSAALATLQRIEPDLRQAVLDEWQVRCDAGGVQRPQAYLFGILQKALRGDFHPWATQSKAKPSASTPLAPPPSPSPEERQARLDNAVVIWPNCARCSASRKPCELFQQHPLMTYVTDINSCGRIFPE